MKRNKDLDELGISRRAYLATFVRERKFLRFIQRRLYGFDYREMMNMDVTFAAWLYSRLKAYEKWSIHDEGYNSIEFDGNVYTTGEAIRMILKLTGEYLKTVAGEDEAALTFEEEDLADEKLKQAARMWSVLLFYLWR